MAVAKRNALIATFIPHLGDEKNPSQRLLK
jgi:hypothetical protein